MITQAIRFITVGVGITGLTLAGYLMSVAAGLNHSVAMTIWYAVGLAAGFILNGQWTFEGSARGSPRFLRYLALYGLLWLGGLGAHLLLVDRYGLPHDLVQCAVILVNAILSFLLLRTWVFARSSGSQ